MILSPGRPPVGNYQSHNTLEQQSQQVDFPLHLPGHEGRHDEYRGGRRYGSETHRGDPPGKHAGDRYRANRDQALNHRKHHVDDRQSRPFDQFLCLLS